VPLTIDQARAILGEEGSRLTDVEVKQMCRELEDLARLLLRRRDRERSEGRPAALSDERGLEVPPTRKRRRG
jgi:hypothetical protein